MDRALRGAPDVLDAEERLGFTLFAGKGKCATCHFLPLTNGTVPPMFAESEVEVIGVPERAVTEGASLDPDLGRFLVTRAEPHRHAFRTPSVRNAALTAPYMHNGAYRTLAEVVDFYNRGGGVGIGFSQHSGIVVVCDGTPEAARRVERVLWNDPATGVMRHADAGYDEAVQCAREQGLRLPMIQGMVR